MTGGFVFYAERSLIMDHYILSIDDNLVTLESAQAEWKKYHVGVHGVKDVQTAIRELPKFLYSSLVIPNILEGLLYFQSTQESTGIVGLPLV